jgi:hypothetical protein
MRGREPGVVSCCHVNMKRRAGRQGVSYATARRWLETGTVAAPGGSVRVAAAWEVGTRAPPGR